MNKENKYTAIIEVIVNASRLITNGGTKEVISYMEVVKHNAEKAAKSLGYSEEQIKKDSLKLYEERL